MHADDAAQYVIYSRDTKVCAAFKYVLDDLLSTKRIHTIEGRQMILTIELPDTLTEQVREQQIPEAEIKSVVLATLEVWMAQRHTKKSGRFTESAAPFVRRLLTENRELFETLAKR